ncbi:MAG: hypothetical protein AMXMBFR7_31170 [Planctomycetota bacterium]
MEAGPGIQAVSAGLQPLSANPDASMQARAGLTAPMSLLDAEGAGSLPADRVDVSRAQVTTRPEVAVAHLGRTPPTQLADWPQIAPLLRQAGFEAPPTGVSAAETQAAVTQWMQLMPSAQSAFWQGMRAALASPPQAAAGQAAPAPRDPAGVSNALDTLMNASGLTVLVADAPEPPAGAPEGRAASPNPLPQPTARSPEAPAPRMASGAPQAATSEPQTANLSADGKPAALGASDSTALGRAPGTAQALPSFAVPMPEATDTPGVPVRVETSRTPHGLPQEQAASRTAPRDNQASQASAPPTNPLAPPRREAPAPARVPLASAHASGPAEMIDEEAAASKNAQIEALVNGVALKTRDALGAEPRAAAPGAEVQVQWQSAVPLFPGGAWMPTWVNFEWAVQEDGKHASGPETGKPARPLALSLHVSNEALGRVSFHLAWTDRALNGTVQAERPEVGAQIRSTLHQLGAQLEALGMPSAQLSVREDSNAWLEAGA